MKNMLNKIVILLILIAGISISACKKGEQPTPSNPNSGGNNGGGGNTINYANDCVDDCYFNAHFVDSTTVYGGMNSVSTTMLQLSENYFKTSDNIFCSGVNDTSIFMSTSHKIHILRMGFINGGSSIILGSIPNSTVLAWKNGGLPKRFPIGYGTSTNYNFRVELSDAANFLNGIPVTTTATDTYYLEITSIEEDTRVDTNYDPTLSIWDVFQSGGTGIYLVKGNFVITYPDGKTLVGDFKTQVTTDLTK